MTQAKENKKRSRDQRLQTVRGHVEHLFSRAKSRAKEKNIPIDLDLDYLESIVVDKCPILDLPLSWGVRTGKQTDNSPSLDKLDATKGYIKGNVYWLSLRANTIKSTGNSQEHRLIADWIDKVNQHN